MLEKAIRKEGCNLVKGSFPWKQVEEGVRKSSPKRRVALNQGFISMKMGIKGAQKEGQCLINVILIYITVYGYCKMPQSSQ